jgi:hypothetical protein
MCKVTVARPMALRVSQLMPWRVRTGSGESPRVLFWGFWLVLRFLDGRFGRGFGLGWRRDRGRPI